LPATLYNQIFNPALESPLVPVNADPRPAPPPQPALEDCCQSGCNPCIFDIYQDALERYQTALAQWEQRQLKSKPAKRR